jgi:AcrR family transcriptional regulator
MVKYNAKKNKNNNILSTRKKILYAAAQEFCERGIDGARMKSIAQRAGVNKALLHYYFKSKERLFETILKNIICEIWGKINKQVNSLSSSANIREIIRSVVSAYINTFAENPKYPLIIIRPIINNDIRIVKFINDMFVSTKIGPSQLIEYLKNEIKLKRIRNVRLHHLILNLLGMIIITFLSKPLEPVLKNIVNYPFCYNNDFYQSRIDEITNTICDSIMLKENK